MSLLVFLTILSILVVVHEWGHYITAKKLGIKVEKFSVGFGKKLFSWTSDGTEFMICLVPLGGYVKMAGDERDNCKGQKDEFFSHSVGHRSLVVVMGPVINIVFAYFCFYFLCVTGYPKILEPKLPAIVGEVIAGTPAETAGLQKGDTVLQIDDKKIDTFEDMVEYVSVSEGRPLNFLILREKNEMTKTIVPKQEVIEEGPDKGESIWRVGISRLMFEKYGFFESFFKAFEKIVDITRLTFVGLGSVISGAVPAKDALAGPIGIFQVVRDAALAGFAYLVFITAVISLNLAIFNLFPIPVLDGGHILLFAIEKVRGRPLFHKLEENLTKVGLSLLLCLLLFTVFNDIDRIGWLDSLKGFVGNMQPTKKP